MLVTVERMLDEGSCVLEETVENVEYVDPVCEDKPLLTDELTLAVLVGCVATDALDLV